MIEPRLNEEAINDAQIDTEINKRRWVNRRKMAWIAFKAMMLESILIFSVFCALLITGADKEAMESVAAWWPLFTVIFSAQGGIVMAYIGSAAYSDVRLFK